MIDFIPIKLYTPIFYNVIFAVTIIFFFHTQTGQLDSRANLSFVNRFGFFTFIFIVLYMGLRPIHEEFVDMTGYAYMFERYKSSTLTDIDIVKDPIFSYYVLVISKIMSVQAFFFINTLLYILPLYFVSKKWFDSYWFYAFIFLVTSFSFWSYGVNGIRNGIAGSLFLLGISREKRISQIVWIALSVGFHFSMLLPTVGFVIANIYNNPKKFLLFWLVCIPISIISGNYWQNLFVSIGIDDPRLYYFTELPISTKFSKIGFRWDFLLYSAIAVFAGWYFITKKNYIDKLYYLLYNTFLFANAFWILVIRANFSNRFAYLSWFMMPFIFIYPLLKQSILINQHKKMGIILLLYFAFTYVMNVLLK